MFTVKLNGSMYGCFAKYDEAREALKERGWKKVKKRLTSAVSGEFVLNLKWAKYHADIVSRQDVKDISELPKV